MSVNWLKDFMEELPLVNRLRINGSDLCIEAADEIERLRGLVIAWADAEASDGFHDEPECGCDTPLCVASAALRRAVGR